MDQREERISKVNQFHELCLKAHFNELAPHVYELKGSHTRTLTLCTLIHGNEIGGIEVFMELLQLIMSGKLRLRSNLRLILGNVNAYYEDKRFLETDMNRSFGLQEHKTSEELRAKELEKFIDSSDALIDVHQTIGPSSTAFFIFEFNGKSYDLARYLHPTLPIVTHNKTRAFKGQTSTAYTKSKGIMGITIETGQKGIDNSQISLGLELACKAIETDLEKTFEPSPVSNTFTFHQILNNPNGQLELIKKFNNFDPVKRFEVLARDSMEEVQSEVDGVILFPKYGTYARTTLELALILKPVQSREEI